MKRQMKLLMMVIILVLISGCSKRKPELYESWMGGFFHDKFEVKKALLECGYPGYWNPGNFKQDFTLNDQVIADKCMEKSGFSGVIGSEYPSGDYYERMCNDPKGALCTINQLGVMLCSPRPPACDIPLSEIPNRSVKRRLESPFCVMDTRDPLCKP